MNNLQQQQRRQQQHHPAMEISEKLFLQYKLHLTVAAIASLTFSLLLYTAPRLLTVLSYFLPLLASTTVFLILITSFGGGFSRLNTDPHQLQQGQGLLDYVAGHHHSSMDSHAY